MIPVQLSTPVELGPRSFFSVGIGNTPTDKTIQLAADHWISYVVIEHHIISIILPLSHCPKLMNTLCCDLHTKQFRTIALHSDDSFDNRLTFEFVSSKPCRTITMTP